MNQTSSTLENIPLSSEGEKKHFENEMLLNKLLMESEVLEKRLEEWEQTYQELNGSGAITPLKRRELKKGLRKLNKKYSAVIEKLTLLRIKNLKETVEEVDEYGQVNSKI